MDVHTAHWLPSHGWSAALPRWDAPGTLVMAYASPGLRAADGPLRDVLDAYPTSCVVGCSTPGGLAGGTVADDGLALAVARLDSTRLTAAQAPVVETGQSYDVGHRLGAQLLDRDRDLQAVFVLSDGAGVDGSALVAGLAAGAGGRPVSGGVTGDGDRLVDAWVLVDGEQRSGYVSVVGLGGRQLSVRHACGAGWDAFGPQRKVTRSRGNVLFELDGEPALALYKRYLGHRALDLPTSALLFPLSVQTPDPDRRQLVRAVAAINELTQSITLTGPVPQGSRAQLRRVSLPQVVAAAQGAVEQACPDQPQPLLAAAVSCAARRLPSDTGPAGELEAAVYGLPAGTGLVGWYARGGIFAGPAEDPHLHDPTMTVTTFAEVLGAGR